jgi:hypothetical protein
MEQASDADKQRGMRLVTACLFIQPGILFQVSGSKFHGVKANDW